MNKFLVRAIVFCTVSILTACQPMDIIKPSGSSSETVTANVKAAKINASAGAEYIKLGDYNSALQKLEKALIQDPTLPSAHATIAVLYQQLGRIDDAEKHFKEAIKRDPGYSAAHNNYGVFLCENKRYSESEKQFLEAANNPLYANPAQAYENAALCVDKIPDATQAEKYFRKALQLNPYLQKSLLKMADLSYQNIDYITAREYLERYHLVARWTAQALLIGIKTEHKLGDTNAVASYKLLLKSQFPDSEEAIEVKQGNY